MSSIGASDEGTARSNHSDIWILDFRSTYHVCHDNNQFIAYQSVEGSSVCMGNQKSCK